MQLQNEMIAELTAQNEQLKIKNAEAKPKAAYYDTFIEQGNSTNLRNTAKELGIPEKQFIKQLQLDKFLYRDQRNQLCPYSDYVQKGYFEMKEWQHGEKSGIQTLITVTGKHYFIGKYKKAA
ncbi:MAG: phage antirepressor KilAC domain-containing protein [Treponema sp.]